MAFALWMLAAPFPWAAAQTGTLEGVVKDAREHVIQGAKVVLTRPDAGEYREITVLSDSQGHFIFKDIPTRSYLVFAEKPKDGYPDASFAFFAIGQPRPQEIKLNDGTTTTIEVKIGQSDGTLSAIVEDESGEPIPGAKYRLFSVDNPDLLIISGADRQGQIETLVPGVPVILQTEAVGFQKWRSDPILITAGQIKQLKIRLTSAAKRR